MRHRVFCLSASIALFVAASAAGQTPKAAALKNPVASTPASVATGQQVYQRQCRTCHGASGKADTPVAKRMNASDLTDATWTHGASDGEIFTVIRDGAGPQSTMKPFKDKISDQDAWHLVNYIRSLAGATK
ncbi:MAG: c-type cytochrome [Vicinamibacterales bacterium]